MWFEILKTFIHNHLIGPELWLFAGSFLQFPILYERTVKALVGLLEPSLFIYVIITYTINTWASSNIHLNVCFLYTFFSRTDKEDI